MSRKRSMAMLVIAIMLHAGSASAQVDFEDLADQAAETEDFGRSKPQTGDSALKDATGKDAPGTAEAPPTADHAETVEHSDELGGDEDQGEESESEGDDWGDLEEIDDVDEDAIDVYTDEDTWHSEAFPQFDRHFNLMTARAARPFSFLFAVYHRVSSPIRDDPFENFLGFDSGALKVGLALRYGIIEGLDVGIFRLNGTVESFDTYEFDARYQLTNQRDHFVDVAVRGGASWFVMPNNRHALKPFGQILIDRVFFNRLLVSLGVLVHGDSSNPVKAVSDEEWTIAGSAAVDVRITEWLAWGAEVAFAVAGYHEQYPTITTGPKFITNRHTFSIVITNTQNVTADGVITNTARRFEDVLLGFNITRELNLL